MQVINTTNGDLSISDVITFRANSVTPVAEKLMKEIAMGSESNPVVKHWFETGMLVGNKDDEAGGSKSGAKSDDDAKAKKKD